MLANILLIVLLVCWVVLWIAAVAVAGISYLGALRADEGPSTLAKVGGGIALAGMIVPCGPFQMLALVGVLLCTVAGFTSPLYADQRIARGVQLGVGGLVIGSILLCGGFGCCSSFLEEANY